MIQVLVSLTMMVLIYNQLFVLSFRLPYILLKMKKLVSDLL